MPATSAAALQRKRDFLREWKKRNPNKVREQRKRYRERKARRERTVKYEKTVLREVRVVLTDYRRTPSQTQPPPSQPSQSTNNPQNIDDFDPHEILRGCRIKTITATTTETTKTNQKAMFVLGLWTTDEELLWEMEDVLAEPENLVKRRIRQIKKSRKRAEETELGECEKDKKKHKWLQK